MYKSDHQKVMRRSQSLPNLSSAAAHFRVGDGLPSKVAPAKAGLDATGVHKTRASQAWAIVQSYCEGLSSDQHALYEALTRTPDGALDLFRCEPEDVLAVPGEVMQAYVDAACAADRPLSLLRWPDEMPSQPTWIDRCQHLTVFDAGFYRGKNLDVRACTKLQRVFGSVGPEVQEILVPGLTSCDVLPYRHGDGYWLVFDKGGTAERLWVRNERLESVSAQMTKNPGVEGFEDLDINCKAVFQGEKLGVLLNLPIECRHLAAFWMACRIRHLLRHEGAHRWSGGAPHEPFDYKPFTSVQALEAHSEEIANAFYQYFCCGMVAGYGVVRKTAGSLFKKFFKDMDEQCRSYMHCFLINDKHCMALELRLDVAPDGKVRYRASFYDPNSSAMHLSQWTTQKDEVATWVLQNFFTYSRNADTQFGMNDNDHELMTVYEVARSFPQGWQGNMSSLRTAPYEHWVPQGEPLHPRSIVQLLRIGRWKEWLTAIQDWRQAHLEAFEVLPTKEETLAYLSDVYSVQQPWHRDELWQRPESRHVFMKTLLDAGFAAMQVNDIMCKLMACVPPRAESLDAQQAKRLKGLPEDVRSRVLLEVLDLAMPRPQSGQLVNAV